MQLQESDGRIWFSSDLHFNHNKGFLFEPRGFQSIEEHDAKIIENWNSVVAPDDIVFLLGDLMMGANYENGIKKIKQLNGLKFHIRGNHDTDNKIEQYATIPNYNCLGWAETLIYKKWRFFLCHYPTMINNYPPESKKFCLHGHTHHSNKLEYIQNGCYNVNIDAHNNFPVCLDQILDDLRDVKAQPMKLESE